MAGRLRLGWIEPAPVVTNTHTELARIIAAGDGHGLARSVPKGVRERLGRDGDDLRLHARGVRMRRSRVLDPEVDSRLGERNLRRALQARMKRSRVGCRPPQCAHGASRLAE